MRNYVATCISSYKNRGYYFFTRPSTAGIIRMRVLFEGVDYSKKLSTLKVKQALMPLYDAIFGDFQDE